MQRYSSQKLPLATDFVQDSRVSADAAASAIRRREAHPLQLRRLFVTANGGISFWWQQIGVPELRPTLSGSIDVDVAIVGAGYTGMWTAYYLKKAQPDLRIALLESRFAGFGASGRNGGWLTHELTGGRERYAHAHGRQAAIDHQQALNATVDEVIATAAAEGIDADIVKGGELNVAYTPAQHARLMAAAPGRRRLARRRRGAALGRGERRAGQRRRHPWRHLAPALCPHPSGETGARAVRRDREARCGDLRGDHGHRDPARCARSPTTAPSAPTTCFAPPRASPPTSAPSTGPGCR